MSQENRNSFIRNWLEFWGRRRIIEPIPFTDLAILTEPVSLMIGASGDYVPLPPNTAGIIVSSTGQKQVIVQGGFYELEEGAYTIQYLDLRERSYTFERISASTKDGFGISFTVSILYKVEDPVQIIPVSTPLQSLFTVCTGAVNNYITTHRHEELIGQENDAYIPDRHIIQHVKDKVAFNHVCRAFRLIDVVIVERHGSPEMNKIKQERVVQATENLTLEENYIQKQRVETERRKIDVANAEQDGLIKVIQAQAEARQSVILEDANRLRVELENLRKLPDIQHEQVLRKIDTLEKALEALIRAYIESGFSRGLNEGNVIESFSKSLADVQNVAPQITSERTRPVNELGSTIINLITPPDSKDKEK